MTWEEKLKSIVELCGRVSFSLTNRGNWQLRASAWLSGNGFITTHHGMGRTVAEAVDNWWRTHVELIPEGYAIVTVDSATKVRYNHRWDPVHSEWVVTGYAKDSKLAGGSSD